MKISVFGTGYVGLVSGLGFAEMGHQVLCYDVDSDKIGRLIAGQLPIYEAGAAKLLQKHLGQGIHFTDHFETAVRFSEMIFICVNLDQHSRGHTQTEKLFSLISKISLAANTDKIVVLKSTAPVGSHALLEQDLIKLKSKFKIELVTNPEFLSEGVAVHNFLNPDRILVGGMSASALRKVRKIYQPLLKNNFPYLEMDPTSAEMTKHAANCMLAARVSFMNEIGRLCQNSGSDIESVKKGLALDPRIGALFLNPGPGYGGSCLPKDISSLIHLAEKQKEKVPLLTGIKKTNDLQIQRTVAQVQSIIEKNKIRQVTFWGASYKAGTDDLRCSPPLVIIKAISALKVKIKVYDPAASLSLSEVKFPYAVEICENQKESLNQSELLVVLTEWPEFQRYSLSQIKKQLRTPCVFDAKNLFNPKLMRKNGFQYYTLGRPQ